MNRFIVVLVVLTLLALSAPAVRAQEAAPFIADFTGQLDYVQGQVIALEGAVPQDKYSWRPMEGVRSIGEVYRHVAGGNYLILSLIGIKPPAGVDVSMDEKKWDSGPMDKATVAALLKASFDHVKTSVAKMTMADMGMMVDLFGMKMTKRAALMVLLGHVHEHLGQSIAYARMNAIVPPWTAAEMAKQAEKEKGK
jgi:uncharacterized damage-inducible protein DinB